MNFQGCSIDVPSSPLIEHEVGSPIVIPWEDEDECEDIQGLESSDDIGFRYTEHDGSRDTTLKCLHCTYTTEHRGYFQRHIKAHLEEKRYKCKICEYRTARSDHMNNHLRTHTSEKPFACKQCDFRCAQQATLYNHLNRRHFKDKRTFMCEYCNYRCHIRADMNKHIRKVHEGRCILLGV